MIAIIRRCFHDHLDPTFVEVPVSMVTLRGSPLSLNCSAASSSNLTLFWTKNSENFTLTSLIEARNGIFHYNLIFSDPVTTDSGTYTCKAASQFLVRSIQATASLTVFSKLIDPDPAQ